MSWLYVGVSAASLIGGMYSSSQASGSANRNADRNAQSVADTNAANLQMFHDARGANGSAVLPEYLRGTEAGLSSSAADVARALFGYGGGVNNRIGNAQSMLARYNPAINAGDNTIIDLATGKMGQQRMDALQPVLAARTALAKSRAQTINDSLDQTLAGLRASRAQAGFRGGSTFDINRALMATTDARANAADQIGQARLTNASATQGLDESNRQLLLSSLDQPFQRGQQRMAFNSLPISSLASEYSQALTPLNFFRLPAGNPPQQQAYMRPDIPGNGQIVGAGISAAGQSIGQYLSNQQMMSQLMSMYNKPQASSFSGDWSAGPAIGAMSGGFG